MSQAIPAEETFDGRWPFEARYIEAPGFRMHYADEGEGETVLNLARHYDIANSTEFDSPLE